MNAPAAHSSLAPSASQKWLMCPGYVRAIAEIEDVTSEPAAEGLAAHHISDTCLRLGMDAADFVGQVIEVEGYQFKWTEIDAILLQYGIDATRALGGEFHGEMRVDLSEWLGRQQFGTLDRGMVTDDEIVVNDLKWGRGVAVYPRRNPQAALYALGFWRDVARHKSETRTVRIVIDQPRHPGGGGEWLTTVDELLAFGETARQAAEASRDPDAPLVAGEHCRYCPKASQRGGCGALDAFNLGLLGLDATTLDASSKPAITESEISPERRSYLLLHRPMLKAWLDKIEADALLDALEGEPVPHMKAVVGRRPARKWRDEEEALKILARKLGKRRVIDQKLKSPAGIEREVGRDDFIAKFDHLVDLGEAKPILVSDDDARPAIPLIVQAFDDLPPVQKEDNDHG